MAIMRNRSRTVNGNPTSLWDVGYTHAGLDDGYQACGTSRMTIFQNISSDSEYIEQKSSDFNAE